MTRVKHVPEPLVVRETTLRAFALAINRHFDVDDEARALLVDWLVTAGLDEMVRRAVRDLVRDPSIEVGEVGVKLAAAGHPHEHIAVLRVTSILRCPAEWWPGKRETSADGQHAAA